MCSLCPRTIVLTSCLAIPKKNLTIVIIGSFVSSKRFHANDPIEVVDASAKAVKEVWNMSHCQQKQNTVLLYNCIATLPVEAFLSDMVVIWTKL